MHTVSALVLVAVAACVSALPTTLLRRPANLPLVEAGGRIIGGQDADIGDYPYQVSVLYLSGHSCGGSVISDRWVLTAAHCLDGAPVFLLSARVGSSVTDSGGAVYEVATAPFHEDFSWETLDCDVGLVQVSHPILFGPNVQPVSLALSEVAPGRPVNVTGWGTMVNDSSVLPTQLQVVTVTSMSREDCKAAYGSHFTDHMMCAGDPMGGKDACGGDSGGPLVADAVQYGVVSWGDGCANAGKPGVYANVADLRSWIREVSGV